MADATNYSASHNRLIFLDSMRGLIMVLMALDHASFFIAKTHSHEFWGTAMPRYDSAMPFLMRAVTHLCAPGFFLMMGVGMALFIAARVGEGWGNWRVARFFVIRGFLLIVLQQFLENPAWYLGSLGTATGAFISRGGRYLEEVSPLNSIWVFCTGWGAPWSFGGFYFECRHSPSSHSAWRRWVQPKL